MPPPARIPTVEFRSLLLPPIRVPFRALQTLHRPQCAALKPRSPPQCLTQRRALNLYKTAKSRVVLGQHKSLIFSPYELEPPSATDYRINLYKANKNHKHHQLVAEDVSFQEVYDNHVKPGRIIYNMNPLVKDMAKHYMNAKIEQLDEIFRNYSFFDAHSHHISIRDGQKGGQLGGLKNVIFNESSPVSYYRLCMDRAYQFIEHGKPVEFRIRLQCRTKKEDRHKPGDPTIWPWLHARFPHLRPDFIVKAMPEDTRYLIHPVTDGRVMQWVVAHKDAASDLDKKFFRMQDKVKSAIKEGRASMLPKAMREQLVETGNDAYSPSTGMTRRLAQQKFRKGGAFKYGAEEKKALKREGDAHHFFNLDNKEDRWSMEGPQKPQDPPEGEERQHRWMGRGSKRQS